MKKEWFTDRLRRFYRGAADGMCMNNNGSESNNSLLKDTGTFHEQMPILEFLPTLKAWIGSESRRRDPENMNYIKFALKPGIEASRTKDLTDGWALVQKKWNSFEFKLAARIPRSRFALSNYKNSRYTYRSPEWKSSPRQRKSS
jgi:hypothetical protein